MRDEAKLWACFAIRNIIKVHELTSLDNRTAVVMEYLDSLDLGTIIEQMRNMRRRLPPRKSLEITATVAVALDAAYNQSPFPGEKPLRVIHRDIKPSNIMIDTTGLVKVLILVWHRPTLTAVKVLPENFNLVPWNTWHLNGCFLNPRPSI